MGERDKMGGQSESSTSADGRGGAQVVERYGDGREGPVSRVKSGEGGSDQRQGQDESSMKSRSRKWEEEARRWVTDE